VSLPTPLCLLPPAVAVAAAPLLLEVPALVVSQDLAVAQLVAAPTLLEVAAQLAPDEVKDLHSHRRHPPSERARVQLALPALERLEMEESLHLPPYLLSGVLVGERSLAFGIDLARRLG